MIVLNAADQRHLEDALFTRLATLARDDDRTDEIDSLWGRQSRLCVGFANHRGFTAWCRDELRHRAASA